MTIEERLWKTFNKALGQYQLIDEDDKILVGLSGGKDSLLLLDFLARRSKIHVPHFTVEALHVRMSNVQYASDTNYLQHFCDERGVSFHIITTHFMPSDSVASDTTPDDLPSDSKKPACFLCSWQRRKQLFNLAQELGCTKIALGHHQDDLIHTALMNLSFHGHFSTMPVKLKLRKMPLTIIRPLCLCKEEDIRIFAEQQGYEKQVKLCPYERTTHRTSAADIFVQMERQNPEARYNIFHALEAEGKLIEY